MFCQFILQKSLADQLGGWRHRGSQLRMTGIATDLGAAKGVPSGACECRAACEVSNQQRYRSTWDGSSKGMFGLEVAIL